MLVFSRTPKNNHSQKTIGEIFWIDGTENVGLNDFIYNHINDCNTVKIVIEDIEMPFAVCKVTKTM